MILTNIDILAAIEAGDLKIDGLAGRDPSQPPFNTTSVDLTLGEALSMPIALPLALDLSKTGIASYLQRNSTHYTITQAQPYALKPMQFLLGQTAEKVAFPVRQGRPVYCARVEGRSSVARCGILVHFTAPTIHANFAGSITLEIINLGPNDFQLFPGMAICQLIVEEVKSIPANAPNQFKNQQSPSGLPNAG
jgi:dCTP deaminase